MSNDSNKRPIANDEIPYPSFRKIMFTQIDNKDTVVFLICKKAICCLALIIEESETHAGLIRATINKIKKVFLKSSIKSPFIESKFIMLSVM